MEPKQIFIRASTISVLIGLSPYREKLGLTFKSLLISNLKNDFVDYDEFESIEPDILKIVSNNICSVKVLNNLKSDIKQSTNDLDLINKCEKFLNCKFGKQQEKVILNEYLRVNNLNIKEKSNFRSKEIFNNGDKFKIIVTGNPDAITDCENIIEIKTRIRDKILNKIKPCDETQLQCYLNIYNYNVGHLVEGYFNDNDSINLVVNKINRDPEFFDKYKYHIYIFAKVIHLILSDEHMCDKFVKLDQTRVDDFLSTFVSSLLRQLDYL